MRAASSGEFLTLVSTLMRCTLSEDKGGKMIRDLSSGQAAESAFRVLAARGTLLASAALALALSTPCARAAVQTITVSGVFSGSDIADPAQNSLAGLLGKAFTASFTLDDNPASLSGLEVVTQTATDPGTGAVTATAWNFLTHSITISVPGAPGGFGYTSPSTIAEVDSPGVVIATPTTYRGTVLAPGSYDSFSVNGHAPNSVGCPGVIIGECPTGTGINTELDIAGQGMLANATSIPPLDGTLTHAAFGSLSVEQTVNGQVIGEVYLAGNVSGTFLSPTITPVPEPDTWELLLAGVGAAVLAAVRRRRRSRDG